MKLTEKEAHLMLLQDVGWCPQELDRRIIQSGDTAISIVLEEQRENGYFEDIIFEV